MTKTDDITYVIEIEKWGIKQVSFGKPPYTENEWLVAYNNLLGLNNALSYANDNGINRIIIPKGIYSFCYTNLNGGSEFWQMKNTSIKLFSNQTLDLNGSIFEVIYDSINKNPYDKSPVNVPSWMLSGKLIEISDCHNSHVVNGTIIGDIPNRSFSDSGIGFNSEKGMEQTYGIMIDNGSKFCSVKNMDISMFMGDGVIIGAYPTKVGDWTLKGDTIATQGFFDTYGKLVKKDGAYISGNLTINKGEHKEIQMRTGGGYTRIPVIKGRTFEYIFFNSLDKIITRKQAIYLQIVTIPLDASYVRIQFTDENIGLSSLNIHYAIVKPQASFIEISHCIIHDNHRGGISGGADYTLINYNKIYNNGMDSGLNVPLFPDTTRYAINFEDSYAKYVIIENNHIFSGFNGLLMGVYNAKITGNIFESIGGVGVYNNSNIFIENNVFNMSSGIWMSNSIKTQERNVTFSNNTVTNSSFSLSTTENTRINIIGNTLNLDSFKIEGGIELVGNRFRSLTGKLEGYLTSVVDCKKVVDNTFERYNDGTHFRLSVLKRQGSNTFMSGNVFRDVFLNSVNLSNDIQFDDCHFFNSSIQDQVINKDKSSSILFNGCTFTDSTILVGGRYINNLSNGGINLKTTFNRCDIAFTLNFSGVALVNIADNKGIKEYPHDVLPRTYEVVMNDSNLVIDQISKIISMMKYINVNPNIDIDTTKTVTIQKSNISLDDNTKFRMLLDRDNHNTLIKDSSFSDMKLLPQTNGKLEFYDNNSAMLQVNLPIASIYNRGKIVTLEGLVGESDTIYICVKKKDDTYYWRQLI